MTESAEFDRLSRLHRRGLERLAVALVDDRRLAEDLVQDAFMALHRRWAELRSVDAAHAYLRTSVLNAARSELRRRRLHRRAMISAVGVDEAAADGGFLLAEEHLEVVQAVRDLPPRRRQIVVLRYWLELTERETAEALGISIGSVKSGASRALNTIAHALNRNENER